MGKITFCFRVGNKSIFILNVSIYFIAQPNDSPFVSHNLELDVNLSYNLS